MPLVRLLILIVTTTAVNATLQVLNPSKSVVVPTGGPIVGRTVKTSVGTVADVFLGIPYGEPPVGDLRFRAPLPRRRWSDPLQCQQYAAACPQNTTFGQHLTTLEKSEDCLFLNVFTGPNCRKENPCAVIYYVHGGVNEFDSPRGFPPEFLVDNWVSRNITFVTPAYRLGVLGFWSTGTADAPGNYALRDILLGAQWVKDNIHVFGGNGSQITAVGYSSSAGLISLLTLSPLSAGVFQQAILISGTGFWVSYVNHTTLVPRYEFVAQQVGCSAKWTKWDSMSASQITACMRNISAEKLVEAFVHPSNEDQLEFFGHPANFIKPGAATGDASMIDGPGGILPEPFETLVSKRRPMPLMLGTTTKEWFYQLSNLTGLLKVSGSNASTAVLKTFCALVVNKDLIVDAAQKNTVIDQCLEVYQKRLEQITAAGPNPLDTKHSPLDLAALELYNDADMYAPMFADAASMRASFGASLDQPRLGSSAEVPVYLYEFAYAKPGEEWYQPSHAFDLRFLSGSGVGIGKPTPRDEEMKRIYVDLYANFAKYSNPTPAMEKKVLESENLSTNREKTEQTTSSSKTEKTDWSKTEESDSSKTDKSDWPKTQQSNATGVANDKGAEIKVNVNVNVNGNGNGNGNSNGNGNGNGNGNVNVNVNVQPRVFASTPQKKTNSSVPKWDGLAYPLGYNYYRIDLPAPEMRSDYHTAAVLFWGRFLSAKTKLVAKSENLVKLNAAAMRQREEGSMPGWLVILFAVSGVLATSGFIGLVAYRLRRRRRSPPLIIGKLEKSQYRTFAN